MEKSKRSMTTTTSSAAAVVVSLLLQRLIITILAIVLMNRFQKTGILFYIPGEYLVPPFFLLLYLQEKIYGEKRRYCDVGLWDIALIFVLVSNCESILSLPTTYTILIIGILLQSLLLGVDVVRRLQKSEKLNRQKKYDEDDVGLSLDTTIPKNEKELLKLRSIETRLRKEKKLQQHLIKKEAVSLSGLSYKEANSITIV
mmetsp:Transcript_18730/g.20879  ORF Transcript_18730/g.20879 Transcript_18730/m.20879 type:complete len:200 (+) Transcript_18730:148-747(+)